MDGTFTGRSFQTGEETTATLRFELNQNNSSTGLKVTFDVAGPGTSTTMSINDIANATMQKLFSSSGCSQAIAVINGSIEQVSDSLQNIGSISSRLTVKEATLRIAITNTESAKSRILDADMAFEQLESTRLQILQQTATAQLAQANIAPQNVLALFQ